MPGEPVVFDGRDVWDPARMAELGFHYESIGRLATSAVAAATGRN